MAGELLPDEVVLVDDGSDDGTDRVAAALARDYPERVKWLQLPTNRGPASARNAGTDAARGDLYFFLDADTELDSKALAAFSSRIAEADAVYRTVGDDGKSDPSDDTFATNLVDVRGDIEVGLFNRKMLEIDGDGDATADSSDVALIKDANFSLDEALEQRITNLILQAGWFDGQSFDFPR